MSEWQCRPVSLKILSRFSILLVSYFQYESPYTGNSLPNLKAPVWRPGCRGYVGSRRKCEHIPHHVPCLLQLPMPLSGHHKRVKSRNHLRNGNRKQLLVETLKVLWHNVCHQGHGGFNLTNPSSCARLEAQVWAEVERGKQESKAVSLVRRACLGAASASKGRACMWMRTGGWDWTSLSRLSRQLNHEGPVMHFSASCFNIPQGNTPSCVCCLNTQFWSKSLWLDWLVLGIEQE